MKAAAPRHFANLEPPRLSLVPPGEADPGTLAAALDDFEVSCWLTRVPHPHSRADAKDHADANMGRDWTASAADGTAGGVTTDPDFGCWVARRAWGRGCATEMSTAVVDARFSDPDAGALVSGHFEGNVRSRRVLDRLGFHPAGTGTQRPLSLGRDAVLHRMTLVRADWAEARLRVAPN